MIVVCNWQNKSKMTCHAGFIQTLDLLEERFRLCNATQSFPNCHGNEWYVVLCYLRSCPQDRLALLAVGTWARGPDGQLVLLPRRRRLRGTGSSADEKVLSSAVQCFAWLISVFFIGLTVSTAIHWQCYGDSWRSHCIRLLLFNIWSVL